MTITFAENTNQWVKLLRLLAAIKCNQDKYFVKSHGYNVYFNHFKGCDFLSNIKEIEQITNFCFSAQLYDLYKEYDFSQNM